MKKANEVALELRQKFHLFLDGMGVSSQKGDLQHEDEIVEFLTSFTFLLKPHKKAFEKARDVAMQDFIKNVPNTTTLLQTCSSLLGYITLLEGAAREQILDKALAFEIEWEGGKMKTWLQIHQRDVNYAFLELTRERCKADNDGWMKVLLEAAANSDEKKKSRSRKKRASRPQENEQFPPPPKQKKTERKDHITPSSGTKKAASKNKQSPSGVSKQTPRRSGVAVRRSILLSRFRSVKKDKRTK